MILYFGRILQGAGDVIVPIVVACDEHLPFHIAILFTLLQHVPYLI